ncbi:MAG: hypothetical protein ABJN40_16085 [Sneathiella sp.]
MSLKRVMIGTAILLLLVAITIAMRGESGGASHQLSWFALIGLMLTLLGMLLLWVVRDYKAWIALGPGGVPHNIFGWIIITAMRPLGGDPFDRSGFEARIGEKGDSLFLKNLPERGRDRPTVAPHPVPHRQIDQIPDAQILKGLADIFEQLVKEKDRLLENKLSQYEKRNFAVWLKEPAKGNPAAGGGGEIAHFHHSDGSMHAILSPSDAKVVMEKGWGELHQMARFKRVFPTETYVLLYAPTCAEDLPIIRGIIEAAVQYAQPQQ